MPRWSVWYVRFALCSLIVGVSMGAVRLAVPETVPSAWIWAHIELLFLGWFLHLAFGVAAWILPRQAKSRAAEPGPGGGRYGDTRLIWVSFALTSCGTLAATLAQMVGPGLIVGARVLVLAGCAVFAVYSAPRIRAFADGT